MPPLSDVTSGLLSQAWAALGGEQNLLELVSVTGDAAGLLPSTLAALPAMLAAVAASTLAASVLDAARRSDSAAAVVVDAEHVALAARSERFGRDGGQEGRSVRSAFAVLANGRRSCHCSIASRAPAWAGAAVPAEAQRAD